MRTAIRDRRPALVALVALSLLALLALAADADARPNGAGKGKQPNILVVMTDDMAQSDLQFMPNVRRKLLAEGHLLHERDRRVPALLPGPGDVHHRPVPAQPRRDRQLRPYGWYG